MTHLEIFAECRAQLFTLACGMLRSVADAEDLLQETFLNWQKTSLTQVRSPKAFLYTILKHLCLNYLQSAKVRREECLDPLPHGELHSDFPDSATLEPRPESLAPALLILLERLSPIEQVVFLLREVFDCEYEEIAAMIRKNVDNCRQLLCRARQHITAGHSRFVASPEELERLVDQFLRTCANGDLTALVGFIGH